MFFIGCIRNIKETNEMKIVIHTMYFLPEFGSAPILMNELAVYLVKKGHEVEVVTTIPRPPNHKKYRWCLFKKEHMNGYAVKRYRTNFTVHPIGRLIAWTIYTWATLLNLFCVKKEDVLFLRLPPLQLGVTGVAARVLKKARFILNVQDIHPDLSVESGILSNPFLIRLAQRFEKWIYRHSERILVISDGFKNNLVKKGVDRNKVGIIPNWVDTDFLKPMPKKNALARRHALHHKFVVMYSGTISISSISTLENILESAVILQKSSHILFVIVGEGMKKKELVDKAKSLNLKNVIFLPFQPYEDLPALLASSDILLVPLDKEKSLLSVPSKLYNFMAAGRPIMGLAHSDSEVKDLIETTECGVCISPEDIPHIAKTIEELHASSAALENMAHNARKYAVENYAMDLVLDNLEKYILSEKKGE